MTAVVVATSVSDVAHCMPLNRSVATGTAHSHHFVAVLLPLPLLLSLLGSGTTAASLALDDRHGAPFLPLLS